MIRTVRSVPPQTRDVEASKPWRWQKLMGSKVLILSVILHLLFGLGAAYVVISRYQAKRKLTFSGGPPSTNASKRALEHNVAMGKKRNMMSAPAQAKRITTTGLAKVALPEMPTMASASDVLPNRMAGLGGAGFGPGIGGAGGGLGGGGGGSGINFFGLRARAKNVVFVVDVSGSMIMGKKSMNTYEDLEKEVIKVINGLDVVASFGIVVFAGDVATFRDNLVAAKPEEKQAAARWLKKMRPVDKKQHPDEKDDTGFKHSGTHAGAGLKKAFAMEPDVVFFVSDGEPRGGDGENPKDIHNEVSNLQKKLPKPAIINSIAYLADNGQDFMHDLASKNKGAFREVK